MFTYMSLYEQVLQQVHQEILRKETVICELQRETRGLREKTLKLKKKVKRLHRQLNKCLREYVVSVDQGNLKKKPMPKNQEDELSGAIATEHGWQHASTEHCYRACVIEVM